MVRRVQKHAMLEDAARSGLTAKECERLKFTYLSETQTETAVKIKAPGYKIPYFNLKGKPNGFYRVRLLGPPKGRFGASQQAKPLRYTQPAGSGAHLYFSPLQEDWETVAKDVSQEIYITEGEKKASVGCKYGIPTVGIGGVWSFMSRKNGEWLIKDFEEIVWKERFVTIVFDSDLKDNEHVQGAMIVFARRLTEIGAKVFFTHLPEGEAGAKQGLDDYLLANGVEGLEDLQQQSYALALELWRLNEEIAIVRNPGAIYDFPTRQLLNKDTAVNLLYANRVYQRPTEKGFKKESVMAEWMTWSHRRIHERLAYVPGEGAITRNNEINTWRGWGVEPKRGDVKIWNQFLDYMFSREPGMRKWFDQWLAYPLQNPGAKLYTSAVIHGLTEGTGKTFIGVILGRIYGANYVQITQQDLESQFNEWAVGRQFVMGAEITGSDKRREADKIKHIISREEITINMKHRPTYELKDCINYYFTSNHPDAMFLDPTDRRYMVLEAPDHKMDDGFYKALHDWCWSEAGPAALFYHMLYNVDCSAFNSRGPAPQGESKANMQDLSVGDLDMFTHDLKRDPDSVLVWEGVKLDGDLYTTQDLVNLYDREGTKRTTLIAMSKSLRRAGFKPPHVTTVEGATRKLWAIRNGTKWHGAGHNERVAHYGKKVVSLSERRAAKYKPKEVRK